MDAYVEFCTLEDAMKAVERHHNNTLSGRQTRLGERNVDVELSSQAHLMKDLFPLAVGLLWNGATPDFKPHNPNEPWDNFKGFISEEEMVMLVKHVEVPHRVSRTDFLYSPWALANLAPLVSLFQGVPSAAIRVPHKHFKEVSLVFHGPHHHFSAPGAVQSYLRAHSPPWKSY